MIYLKNKIILKSISFNYKFFLLTQVMYNSSTTYSNDKYLYLSNLVENETQGKFPNNKMIIEINNNSEANTKRTNQSIRI